MPSSLSGQTKAPQCEALLKNFSAFGKCLRQLNLYRSDFTTNFDKGLPSARPVYEIGLEFLNS